MSHLQIRTGKDADEPSHLWVSSTPSITCFQRNQVLHYTPLLHHPTRTHYGRTNWTELLLSHCMRPTSSSRILAWQTKVNNTRSPTEPFKTKFQPPSVGSSKTLGSTCTLFFKVHTRYIPTSFYITYDVEFYGRVVWFLICSWTSRLYMRAFWFAQLGPMKPPFQADKSTLQILTRSANSFCRVY